MMNAELGFGSWGWGIGGFVTVKGIISSMSTTSLPLSQAQTRKLRPLNIMRDLPQVADLVEHCFQNMDREGKRYVQQIRKEGKNHRWLSWASTSLPLKGFVWEDEKKIVGNISIVPFHRKKERHILLANVAVHPAYRRRGIARLLTQKALAHLRNIRHNSIWVHVESNNQDAINLYQSLGFQRRARRATWEASTQVPPQQMPKEIAPLQSAPRRWTQQKDHLSRTYPKTIAWYRMPDWEILAPGLKNWLYRFFIDDHLRQWVLEERGDFQAALIWKKRRSYRAPIWLAAAPQTADSTLSALLLHARLQLAAQNRKLYLDYPAETRAEAFQQAGFRLRRTLVWMQAATQNEDSRIS